MKKMYKFISVYLYLLALVMLVCWSFVSANTLSIMTWDTYTWRYFCPIDLPVTVNYDGEHWFGNCQYGLEFDSDNVVLQFWWMGSNFTKIDQNYFTWNNDNILYIDVKNQERLINETSVCSKIIFNTISPVQTSTTIKFVDRYWNYPTSSTFLNTTEWLNASNGGTDTLTWVQDLKINLFACPCTLDNNEPTIHNWSHNTTTHYLWPQTIRFLVYDKWWTSRSYWTNWTKNFANYTGAWVPSNMDNQEWINSGTIVVKVYSWDTLITTMNAGDDALTITEYTWSNDIPRFTWDGNIRWYWVSFNTDFVAVETPVKIEVSVSDNALVGSGPCQTNAHTTVESRNLNQREKPIITFNAPTWQNVNPNVWVELTVSDSRAWINTGSLVVQILEITSWWQVIMSWSVYSWSDLHFQLIAGSGVLWWASKYKVTFQPKYEFAVDSTITLSGYVEDLVGMTGQKTHQFHTRKDCTFYGCVNFVDIFFGDMWNLILNWFTWSLIVITGTIAQYPYLTWSDWEIVMCGPIDDSINLTWNIDIYSGGVRINGNMYPDEELYVTGLDFEYQDGVIIPRY